ncbi:DUF1648 domain-containing protein [Streptomyces lavendofoliae]|uniref:DUF1648 domain-containing protein n=1 Tax=Streptomyces lavendofoliae TaxID=67314 RepID=UPI003D944241
MNGHTKRKSRAIWGTAGWSAGILVLLVGMPLVASGRLPERLATHWAGASGDPDSSMPLWAAALFPALAWVAVVAGVVAASRWTDSGSGGAVQGWTSVTLVTGGILLAGGQASVVRANLDRTDWRRAGSVTGWIVLTLIVSTTAGLVAWLVTRRGAAAPRAATDGPSMDLPAGQRLVWLSRTSNWWLHGISAVTGLVAIAAALAAACGLTDLQWALITPLTLASVLVLGCASVQARVSEGGLEVSFGPFGWPTRHWAAEEIELARAEHRTPAQVGGWGYRLSGLGTTVMLRGGECLVIRAKGKDFALSVDDAERGAALLNSLRAERSK